MNNFFSYGTIQQEKVQLELYGHPLEGVKDFLPGYKIISIENTDPLSLARGEEQYHRLAVPSGNTGDLVEGTVFQLSNDELELTDRYEPDGYSRIKVQLQSGSEAWIYVGR